MMVAIGSPGLSGLFVDGTPGCESLSRIALSYLDKRDRCHFSSVNRYCYQLAMGEPFIPISGQKDRYAVIKFLRRRDAEAITAQTELQIDFPAGQSHFGVVTSWEDHSSDKLCLGKGSFGVFCIAYALKQQNYVGLKITMGDDQVEAELAIHQALSGTAHLIESIDFCRVKRPDGRVILYQVMPLAGLGSADRLREPIRTLADPALRDGILRHVARGLLSGIGAMHARGWVHLDVKPANLVLDRQGARLIDVGCSQQPREGEVNGLFSLGDFNYFSPERWLATMVDHPDQAQCNGELIDAWSAGITLLEMARTEPHVLLMTDVEMLLGIPFGYLPDQLRKSLSDLEGQPRHELFRSWITRQIGDLKDLPEGFGEVVKGLLAFDVGERWTVQRALESPWLSNVIPEEVSDRLRELVQSLPSRQESASRDKQVTIQRNLLSPQEKPLPHFVNYIHRMELEQAVRGSLLAGPGQTVLQGPPGCGKTQLATFGFHLEEVQEHFGLMLWFRGGDSRSQIELQFRTLAQELRLAEPDEEFEVVFPRVEHYLRTLEKPWLLVFDNADDPEMLARYSPPGGHILVTSRSSQWRDTLSVGPLSLPDATHLVHRLLHKEEPDAARLCEALSCLPLGIVQACAFIRNQRYTISGYLDLFELSSALLTREERQDGHRDLPYSIERLYELTFAALAKARALPLLQRLACLAPDQIPADYVAELIEGAEIDPGAEQLLIDYAILQPTATGVYTLHRLPRRVAREKLSRKELDSAFYAAMKVLTPKWNADAPSQEEIASNRQLLQHGEALLELCPDLDGLSDDMAFAVAVTTQWVMSEQSDVGMPHKAAPLLDTYVPLARRVWTEGHANLTTALNTAGLLYSRLGRTDRAMECYQEGLQLTRDLYGEDDLKVAAVLNNIGAVCKDMGDFAEAAKHHAVAAEIKRKKLGLADPDVAMSMSNLGVAFHGQGKLNEAFAAHGLALQIYEAAYEGENVHVARCLNNLANVERSLGKYSDALGHQQRALDLYMAIYGDVHAMVATSLHNLASMFLDAGDYDRAIELSLQARDLKVEIYQDDHPELANTLDSLGAIYHRSRQLDKAERSLRRGLAMRKRLLPEGHPDMATSLNNLGALAHDQKDYSNARRYHEEAFAIRKTAFPDGHPDLAASLSNLAATLSALGQQGEAIQLYQRSLDMRRSIFGEAHRDVAYSCNNLGTVLCAVENYAAAIKFHELALRIRKEVLGDEHPEVVTSLNNLGQTHWQAGHRLDAIRFQKEAYELSIRTLGGDHETTQTVRKNLSRMVVLFDADKGPKRAAKAMVTSVSPIAGAVVGAVIEVKSTVRAERDLLAAAQAILDAFSS